MKLQIGDKVRVLVDWPAIGVHTGMIGIVYSISERKIGVALNEDDEYDWTRQFSFWHTLVEKIE